MTTASTRIWTFATVIVMIVVVALGWFLGISPKLADAARFDADRQSVIAQNDLARATIAQLQADFDNIDELRLELEELRAEFPTEAAYDDAVEELLTRLLAAELTLQNLAINEPAPTTPLVLDDDTAPPPTEVDGEGVLPEGSLLGVTATVTVTGPLDAILGYMQALQESQRFAIVSRGDYTAETGEGAATGRMTFSLIIYVVSGQDLLDVQPGVEPDDEAEPTEPPAPGGSDPAEPDPDGTDAPAEPTPSP